MSFPKAWEQATIVVKASDLGPALAAFRAMLRDAWIKGYIAGALRNRQLVTRGEAEAAYAETYPDG